MFVELRSTGGDATEARASCWLRRAATLCIVHEQTHNTVPTFLHIETVGNDIDLVLI